MTDEMSNIGAIRDFLSHNGLLRNPGCIAEVRSFIRYTPANINDISTLQIKVDTFNYGEIEILETDKIDVNIVHTGFIPRFNEYQFDEQSNTLTIKGKAHISKGGKQYIVSINPL